MALSNETKKQVTSLFQVHVWLGAIIGILVFWYLIKKNK
jgi:hypothetical protein